MKKIYTIFVLFLCLFALPAVCQENDRSLTTTLEELRSELKNSSARIAENQKRFGQEYNRQHLKMIAVITQTNKLSLLLYTQEQRHTFDMAFALKEVTNGYKEFNSDKRPYDQVIGSLTFEIDRYARLIEALRRLPPEMKAIETDEVPDSLLYRNDSLELHLSNTNSSLENEIIQRAIKDTATAPFVLDEEDEQYRDSCIRYASNLLKMFAGQRDSVITDSTHYQEAYLRAKEAYDYAEERYTELDKYVFHEGQTPYLSILTNFKRQWAKMKRELNKAYDFEAMHKLKDTEKAFYNTISGSAARAFLVVACLIQLAMLALVWLVVFAILWLICRYTKLGNYLARSLLPLLSILVGTIFYFLTFGYVWGGNSYVLTGVENINTFLWLLMALTGSMLLRVKQEQIRHSFMIYLPTLLLSIAIIYCRNTFAPDILVNIVFVPVLAIAVLGQLAVCLIEQGKAPRPDSILGWVSLGVYAIALIIAICGYVFAALVCLVLWYFMLTALLTIFCISDLVDRKPDLFGNTWFHDFIKQVIIPMLLLLSLPWSTQKALDMFDFSDLYTRYYQEPFFQLADEATGVSTLCISALSIVDMAILFFIIRFLNRVVHAVWQRMRYAAFMRKNKRTSVRENEINLSLGNSIISVVLWAIYAVVVIVVWKIPTGSLGLIAGGLSAGIGIALKDILNNFIYGIQLMGGRLRVGDWIECDGIRGKVTAINYQCVQVETTAGTEMSFLNSTLFGKNFNNLTRNNSYELTKISVGVAYGTDVEKARSVILEALQQLRTKDKYGRELVEPEKGVSVVVDSMSDSSVDLTVKQHVLVAERVRYMDRGRELIYNALNEAGITIPFPQCDVHLIKN